MKRIQYLYLIAIIGLWQGCTVDKKSIDDFSALIQPLPDSAKLSQENNFVWGASVVKGDNGLYHMYYSRWPKNLGFKSWVTYSEIAHAISESPYGPFKFKDVALPSRGKDYWDGMVTHNPTVHRYDGKYYLYYMGTTGHEDSIRSYWEYRNNQRIGVAWAESPNGPWHRKDTPVIDVSSDKYANDALMTANPSVTQMKDGRYLMVYKAVAKEHELPFGGPVYHLAAIADSPSGSFQKLNKKIFHNEDEEFPAEDPFIWYDKYVDVYYAIVKDMTGWVSSVNGFSLVLFVSKDGLDWQPAKKPLVSTLNIRWADGAVQNVKRLERPQVLIENGKLKVLYCAVIDTTDNAFNIHIPLKESY